MLLSNYGLPESSEAISAREILTRIFSQSRFPISEKMVKSVFDLYKVKLMEEVKEESSVKNPNNLGLTFTYVDGPTRKLDLKFQNSYCIILAFIYSQTLLIFLGYYSNHFIIAPTLFHGRE